MIRQNISGVLYIGSLLLLCWIGFTAGPARVRTTPTEPDQFSPGDVPDQTENPGEENQKSLKGKNLYMRLCKPCHGRNGTGKGMASSYLFPSPRDFTEAQYRYTNTLNTVPHDSAIHRTIKRGLPRSAMPGFGHVLSEEQIQSLVHFVKSKAPAFENQPTPEKITVRTPPIERTKSLVSKGKKLYRKYDCHTCHGDEGEADGPKAVSEDLWEEQTRATDLTYGIFNNGNRPVDIYRWIVRDICGTPRPDWYKIKNEVDRWALTWYVRSLSDERRKQRPNRDPETIPVPDGTIPSTSDAGGWEDVKEYWISLHPMKRTHKRPLGMRVRTVQNKNRIAFRLSWKDPSRTTMGSDTNKSPDMAALMYPSSESGRFPPFIGMGGGKHNQRVRIWRWKAIPKRNPTPLQKKDHLLKYLARGPGKLIPDPQSPPEIKTDARWNRNRWQVMFVRQKRISSKNDRSFEQGNPIYVSFAVYRGRKGDRLKGKSFTDWIRIKP